MKSTPDPNASDPTTEAAEDAILEPMDGQSAATEEPADASEPATAADSADSADPQQELQAELAMTRDRWLRAMAELENLRKRARREQQTTTNLAKASLLRELLEVSDNFSRALESAPWNDQDEARRGFAEGVRLTYVQFMEILRQNGLQRIEARGASFDPNLHEAISQIETDEVPSQHIVQVIQEGYLLNDMVVRPARVVVAA